MLDFLILALPRSRTAWLSRFLTYGDHICGHEEARHWRSLDDVRAFCSQPHVGSAETAVAPFWRLIDTFAPTTRIVIVRRPVKDAWNSLMRVPGCNLDPDATLRALVSVDRKLDQVAARRPVLSVNFDDLANEATCRSVWEHCLPYDWDRGHWGRLAWVNVQCNLRAMMRYVIANMPALEKLAAIAKHRILTGLALHEPVGCDGMTFQVESFDDWYRDGRKLFEDHLTEVGEAPGNHVNKNLDLLRRLDRAGAMQIVTARANGRMFGYLQTVIGPSLESSDRTFAAHGTFFASPDAPGLGMKLQRAALRALRERGVGPIDLNMQAGPRGSGPRLGTIYRRLGADDFGTVHRLTLEAA